MIDAIVNEEPGTGPKLLSGIEAADIVMANIQSITSEDKKENKIDKRNLITPVEEIYKQGLEVLASSYYYGINPNLERDELYTNINERLGMHYFVLKKDELNKMISYVGLMFRITKELDDFYEEIKGRKDLGSPFIHEKGIYDKNKWQIWYQIGDSTGQISLHIKDDNILLHYSEQTIKFSLEDYKGAISQFKQAMLDVNI